MRCQGRVLQKIMSGLELRVDAPSVTATLIYYAPDRLAKPVKKKNPTCKFDVKQESLSPIKKELLSKKVFQCTEVQKLRLYILR